MLSEWLEALTLGVIQGLTEFLPISSDGHLTIAQAAFARLTGRARSGAENLFFDVMLHLGTLTAILVFYRNEIRTAVRGLLGASDVPPEYRRNAVVRIGLLAIVATLPLIPLKLFVKDWIDRAFQSPTAAGIGFLITAAVLLVTVKLPGGSKGPAETTWLDALLIGIAQMFAPLPGVSRSGVTVVTALALGLSRSWAVGFSLLIAIPAILGAAASELLDVDPATLNAERIAQTAAATVVAGLVGYGAIVWLIRIVRAGRLWFFSAYLIILGIIVLATAARFEVPSHAQRAETLDGSPRSDPPGARPQRRTMRSVEPLDRPVRDGTRADYAGLGIAPAGDRGRSGLVLGSALASRP
jgi:undecaprenyl-diphosphatase